MRHLSTGKYYSDHKLASPLGSKEKCSQNGSPYSWYSPARPESPLHRRNASPHTPPQSPQREYEAQHTTAPPKKPAPSPYCLGITLDERLIHWQVSRAEAN